MDPAPYVLAALAATLVVWAWLSWRSSHEPKVAPQKRGTAAPDQPEASPEEPANEPLSSEPPAAPNEEPAVGEAPTQALPQFQFEDHEDLQITRVSVMTSEALEVPEAETVRLAAKGRLAQDAPLGDEPLGDEPLGDAPLGDEDSRRDHDSQTTARMRRSKDEDTQQFERGVVPIIVDDDASLEIPTAVKAYILLSAGAGTDPGKRRKRNEDYYTIVEDPPLYIVADGMGGHAGGALASAMAVETVAAKYAKGDFDSELYDGLPRRGRELVQAIQHANRRIHDKANAKEELEGMGTTIVCARFSAHKERVYIGHVGDSRCYRVRDDEIQQLTSDHNVAAHGFKGPMANRLTRALGIRSTVIVDLMIGRPKPGDRYILCSDGLSKMVDDHTIGQTVIAHDDPEDAVARLVQLANDAGGKDNTTVIAVYVEPAARSRAAPRET